MSADHGTFTVTAIGKGPTTITLSNELPGAYTVGARYIAFAWDRVMPLPSLANQREHWRARSKRLAMHKELAFTECRKRGAKDGLFPYCVRLVRCGPRKLDSDNLQGAFKAIRDGIAKAFGVDDGDEQIEWLYGQQKEKTVRIAVLVEAMTPPNSGSAKAAPTPAEPAPTPASKAKSRAGTATKKTSGKASRNMGVGE